MRSRPPQTAAQAGLRAGWLQALGSPVPFLSARRAAVGRFFNHSSEPNMFMQVRLAEHDNLEQFRPGPSGSKLLKTVLNYPKLILRALSLNSTACGTVPGDGSAAKLPRDRSALV